jgi:DNA-binding XRE family transcriptional regulator
MITEQRAAVGSRFETFRKNYIKASQTVLAKEAGTTQKTISEIERGIYMPFQDLVTHLATKHKLNPDWLMSGKGNPLSTAKKDPEQAANIQVRLSAVEKRVEDLQETIKLLLEKLS